MTTEIQILAWDRHKNVAELNQLMESKPSLSSLFDLQLQIRYLSNNKKLSRDLLQLKKTTDYHKKIWMSEWLIPCVQFLSCILIRASYCLIKW